MLSRTGRRICIKSLVSETTFLPWLYCTNTILRGYAGYSPRNQPSSGSHIPFEGLPGEPAPNEAVPTGFENTTITPSEAKAFEGLFGLKKRKDGKKLGEHGAQNKGRQERTSESGETDELAAILGKAKRNMREQNQITRESSDGLHNPLSALAEKVNERRIKADADRRLREKDMRKRQKLDEVLKKAVDSDFVRVANALRHARTDVAVWAVLQKILDRVKALDLDTGVYFSASKPGTRGDGEVYPSAAMPIVERIRELPPGTPPPAKPTPSSTSIHEKPEVIDVPEVVAGQEDPAPSSPPPPKGDEPVTDAQILPYTLPRNLHRIALHLSQHYPKNSLSLSVLPALKSLGPTAVALGASTSLFNVHLRELSLQYAHAPVRLVELCSEMEQGDYEPDGITQRILGGYIHEVKGMQRGKYGAAVKMVARSERMNSDLRTVQKWHRIVGMKRNRAVLEQARKMSNEEGWGVRGVAEEGEGLDLTARAY